MANDQNETLVLLQTVSCMWMQGSNARFKSALGSQPHGRDCMLALGFRSHMEAADEVRSCFTDMITTVRHWPADPAS